MRKNTVKEKLQAGQPSIGSWLSIGHSLSAEMMAHAGFDWLTIDTEHTATDFSILLPMLQAISTTSTIPFVRVPWNDPWPIKRTLDLGAYGVVIPDIATAEEAKQAVGACRYPPVGYRGIGAVRGNLYGGPDYYEKANEEIMVVLMIESREGVENAEEIMRVPGVDAVFIGPNDLAASLGVPLGLNNPHPEHKAAVAKILQAGKKTGVPVGIHCQDADEVNMRIEQGFLWLALAGDGRFLAGGAREQLRKVKLPARVQGAKGPAY